MSNKHSKKANSPVIEPIGPGKCRCGYRRRGANHDEGAHHKGEIGRVRHPSKR